MESETSDKSVAVVAKEERKSGLNYNEILTHIGQFGKWQQQIFFWACIVSMANGIVTVAFAFTAFVPKYRCAVPFCESHPNWTYYEDNSLDSFPEFVSAGIPSSVLNKNGDCRYLGMSDLTSDPIASSESCEFYLSEVTRNASDISLMECSDLIFDTSIVQNSIVTDFGLTCNNAHAKNVIGTAYMIGVLIGSLCVGLFADRFGRLTTLMIGAVATATSGLAGAFVNTSEAFAFLRFLTGFSVKGLFVMAFVISVESVGAKFAAFIGIAINIPFAIGELILGLEAYLIRDWRTLQIVAHAPIYLLVLLWFFLPESPRWLIATGRTNEAETVLRRAAKVNGKTLPEKVLLQMTSAKTETTRPGMKKSLENIRNFIGHCNIRKDVEKCQKGEKEETKLESAPLDSASFLDLFRPRVIMWRTLNLFLQWFSVTFVYYGLSFGSTTLGGDPYANFCLNVFVEIPGYLFAMAVMDCWGRKPILAFCQILPGAACILAGLLVGNASMAPLQVFLTLIGKFGASAGFSIVYLYSAELYPTILRSTSIGTCSLVARFGSILALLIELTAKVWNPLPMTLMGGTSVVAGFVAFLLPESAGQPLPETKEEALEIGNVNKRGFCACACPNSWKDFFPSNE